MIDRSSMDSLVRLEYSILTIFTPRRGRLCLYDIKRNPCCMIQLCIGQGERRRRFVLLDRSNSLARQIYPEKIDFLQVLKKGRGWFRRRLWWNSKLREVRPKCVMNNFGNYVMFEPFSAFFLNADSLMYVCYLYHPLPSRSPCSNALRECHFLFNRNSPWSVWFAGLW